MFGGYSTLRRGSIFSAAVVAFLTLLLSQTAGAAPAQPAVVLANPADSTPRVVVGDDPEDGLTVFAFAQFGNTVYAGGRFSQVKTPNGATTLSRSNFVAYDATTGAISSLALNPNNTVQAMVVSGSSLYVAGNFNSIGGVARKGLAKINLTTGAVDTAFNANLGGAVTDMAFAGSRLVLGGTFPNAIRAVDPTTGANTGFINLTVSGVTDPNDGTRVRRLAVNPQGTRLVALGNFTSVGGVSRRQAFQLNLDGPAATVSPWYSRRFDTTCSDNIPMWSRGVDFSPDGSYFVIVTTGAAASNINTKLCDSASRWESASTSSLSQPTWINWTGGDSLYSVSATGSAVYVGGHQRWLDNPQGHGSAGPGAVVREGIAAIDPVTGKALPWNPGKERGHGAEKLLATSTGLWVGSDSSIIAGEFHPGIAFFPLPA